MLNGNALGPQRKRFCFDFDIGSLPIRWLETRILSENRVLKIARTSNNIHLTLVLYNSNYAHNHTTNHVIFCHSNVCCCEMRSEIHWTPQLFPSALHFQFQHWNFWSSHSRPEPPPFKMSVWRFVTGFHCIVFWRFSWGFGFLLCGGLEA